jgi:hypothetical protein
MSGFADQSARTTPFIDGDLLAIPKGTLVALLDQAADPGMVMTTSYMHLTRVQVVAVRRVSASTILAVWGKRGAHRAVNVTEAVADQLQAAIDGLASADDAPETAVDGETSDTEAADGEADA